VSGRKECLCRLKISFGFTREAGYHIRAKCKAFTETTTGICAKLRNLFNRVRAAHQTEYAVRS
jgi:hypothetical protein